MSTSSPISRYHEVYVHHQGSAAGDGEIHQLNEIGISGTTNPVPHCSVSPPVPRNPRPPSYQDSLIELDAGVADRLMGEVGVAPSSGNNHSNNRSTSIIDSVTTVLGERIIGVGGHSGRLDPPTYDEAIDPESAPPPSYDSLFGRVREARKSSKGLMDFAKNVLILLLGTLGCTIILGVTIVVPVCMIVIGMLYMYDCPQGEYIPVYLLVGGGFGVLKQLLHLSTRVRSREDQAAERLRQSPTQQLINCFMFGWFIIGSFWIFKEYEPNYDPGQGKYCNKTLYMFAFWLIMSVYISLGLLTVGLCAIAVGSILTHRRNQTNHTTL